jgi:Ca-activated chloride channel homolog
MTGRHHSDPPQGVRVRVVVAAAAVLVLAAGAVVAWRASGDSSCSGQVRLSVAAAPEIAVAVSETATEWARQATAPGGECVTVDVASAAPVNVAAAVATAADVTLNGVDKATGSTRVPDVWIPDSSAWLVRLRSARPGLVPDDAPSVARSPVVLATPEPVATTLGWPETKPTWVSLLERMTAGTLKVGIVEPTRDAAGLSGLMAFDSIATASGTGTTPATVGTVRAFFRGRSPLTADLVARFPRAGDAAAIGAGLGAAPLSEQAVISYNAGQPPVRLAALYLDPTPPGLDYPYALLPGVSAERAELARGLREALAGGSYRARLGAAGVRGADGTGQGLPSLPGSPNAVAQGAPDAKAVARAVTTWASVTRPGRMLLVMDVSGSMGAGVPTAGGAARAKVAVDAAAQGLSLVDDTWAVGLWTFSTLLNGDKDYQEQVPIGLMSVQRTAVLGALAKVQPRVGGNTGLYDTALAAYRAVQNGWDPASVNSVAILTDGKNQDPQGLSLDQLVTELKSLADPARPIQVIAIGIGDEVSEAELTKISSTTGGGTFIARDPSAIGEIFLKALALRPATGA